MTRIAVFMMFAVAACSGGGPVERLGEMCDNGKDDDNNGFTDCQDIDCSGRSGCPIFGNSDGGGRFGSCLKCGKTCAKQADCLTVDYHTDAPVAECIGGKCQQLNTNVQLRFEVATPGLTGISSPLRSLNTRIISKRAIDGSAATCASVKAIASGKAEADANQIEKSGKFNLRGYDVSKVQAVGGETIIQPFVNIGTGSEFLIWTEVWGGLPSTLTKLPSGNRFASGCFEAGPEVVQVVLSDHCANAGACRTIKVSLTNSPE